MKMPDNLEEAKKAHHIFPNGDNILMSGISEVDFPVSNMIEGSPPSINIEELIPQKFYVSCYENDWYFGIANFVSIENNDVNVKFMYTASKFFGPVGITFAGFLLKILYMK